MSQLAPGLEAPDFTLPRDGGGTISLADFRNRKVVLYFYPHADTPGCTREAQAFSALDWDFAVTKTSIIGVSADPIPEQDAFKAKHDLTIALASDETHTTLEAYGAWGEASMYGKTGMGIARMTVLIGPDGKIARIWPNVTVDGHATQVLAAARAL